MLCACVVAEPVAALAPSATNSPTYAVGEVYMFSSSTTTTGNLGGRSGADSFCKNNHYTLPPTVVCEYTFAVVPIPGETLGNGGTPPTLPPGMQPIQSSTPVYFVGSSPTPHVTQVATWVNLWPVTQSPGTTSLLSVADASGKLWAGFETPFAQSPTLTCSGWTTASPSASGEYTTAGLSSEGANWIESGNA